VRDFPQRIAFVGTGRLARALAGALSGSSVAVTLVSRRSVAGFDPIAAGIGGVVLCVPDRALSEVARRLAKAPSGWRGIAALHAAGAYGPSVLAPLARAGASTGVLHPLAALGAGSAAALQGAYARIEGAPRARALARALAARVGLSPLRGEHLASPRGRAAYHAAASLAANDVLALLDAAHAALRRAGVAGATARRALSALARGVVDQFDRFGPGGALTGPAARGDAPTLTRQLAVLDALDPDAAHAHRALSRRLAKMSARVGGIDTKTAREVATVLARGRRRRRTV
jgi:predicted short-subunit dehydrogenase-like oxidoreductase (DUF2520 family)